MRSSRRTRKPCSQNSPSSAALAQQPAEIAAKLKSLYPMQSFGPVSTTSVPGIYEVVTGDTLSYVDASGRYFFVSGRLIDFKQHTEPAHAGNGF